MSFPANEEFKIVTVSPLVSVTPAYASGDCLGVGAPYTLASVLRGLQAGGAGGSIYLQAVRVFDKGKKDIPLDVVIFRANPTATTFTDNSALAVADADLGKILAVVPVTQYHDFNDNSFGRADNLAIPLFASGAFDLYMALVARGAGAYAASGDLSIELHFV